MDVEEAPIRAPEATSYVPTPRPPRHSDLVMDVEEALRAVPNDPVNLLVPPDD
jgi:hypothetical protein